MEMSFTVYYREDIDLLKKNYFSLKKEKFEPFLCNYFKQMQVFNIGRDFQNLKKKEEYSSILPLDGQIFKKYGHFKIGPVKIAESWRCVKSHCARLTESCIGIRSGQAAISAILMQCSRIW